MYFTSDIFQLWLTSAQAVVSFSSGFCVSKLLKSIYFDRVIRDIFFLGGGENVIWTIQYSPHELNTVLNTV